MYASNPRASLCFLSLYSQYAFVDSNTSALSGLRAWVCGYEVFFCLFFVVEVAVLDADEFSALVEEGRLQPMCALAVGP